MPDFQSILPADDEATKTSFYATALCASGSLIGIVLARFVETFTGYGHLPVGLFLVSVFALVGGYWLSRIGCKAFDPGATFVAFLSCTVASLWILRHFFIDPALGPFAAEFWTVRNILGNALFGITLFALLGATLGLTYYTARRTYGVVSIRRGLVCAFGVGLPILFLARVEYFLTHLGC